MAGTVFGSRDFSPNTGDFWNNPIQSEQLYKESIALSPWGDYGVDVEPTPEGLVLANGDLGSTGIVKIVNVPETAGTRQVTFSFMKEVDGEATFGQNIPPRGDTNQFLTMDGKIGEIRSPNFPLPSNYQKRDGYRAMQLAGGPDAITRRNAMLWAGRQFGVDHNNAMLRGASSVVISPSNGALYDNIGGVNNGDTQDTAATHYGSQALHELIVMPDASGNTVVNTLTSTLAADRATHETAVAVALKALQAASASNYVYPGVDTFNTLRSLCSQYNIKPLKGNDYEYIFHADWQLVQGLLGKYQGTQADTAKAILATMRSLATKGAKGDENPFNISYENWVIDGIKIVPDRTLIGWRPVDITGVGSPTGANVVYGGTSTTQSSFKEAKASAYKTNTGSVGIAFILGDTAIVEARDGGVDILPKEGDQDTGVELCSRQWRSVYRTFWKGRDPSTSDTGLQVGSAQMFFRVPPIASTLY